MKKLLLSLSLILASQLQNYTLAQDLDLDLLYYEDFSELQPPWSTYALTANVGWEIGENPINLPSLEFPVDDFLSSSAYNGFLLVNSDLTNPDGSNGINSSVINDVACDLSGEPIVYLYFEHYFSYYNDTRVVSVSNDNGLTWDDYFITPGDYSPNEISGNPEIEYIDISATAGNQSEVLISFTYIDDGSGWFWAVDDVAILVPSDEPTDLACYETAEFNVETLTWDVSGTQPVQPILACYETAEFDNIFCEWVVSGLQDEEPTYENCWEVAIFDEDSCAWLDYYWYYDTTVTVAGNSYYCPIDGETYSASGDYELIDSVNCAIVFLYLTINPVLGISEEEVDLFSLYPNPVSELLYVNLNGQEKQDYLIIDNFGSVVKRGKLGNLINEISVSQLTAGFYYFKIEGNKPQKFSKID